MSHCYCKIKVQKMHKTTVELSELPWREYQWPSPAQEQNFATHPRNSPISTLPISTLPAMIHNHLLGYNHFITKHASLNVIQLILSNSGVSGDWTCIVENPSITFKKILFICERESDRERDRERRSEGEGQRDSVLSTEPNTGPNPTQPRNQPTKPPGCPRKSKYNFWLFKNIMTNSLLLTGTALLIT